ncbi:MAG: PLDc N-terminal domain-containing protein [Chlorobiaceae bacterium]
MNVLKVTPLVITMVTYFAQVARAASDDAQAAGGCAACSGGIFIMMILPIIIQVAILAWVVKDSRARGIESPLGWMAFVFLVPLIGILVYLFSRPPIKAK